jgi:enoyl-[acyl-carrier protein] reductase I
MSASPLAGLASLAGKRGLVFGIANEHSIATGCAAAFRGAGAMVGASYLNEAARPYVAAVADRLEIDWIAPCDVQVPGQLEAVFERAAASWGGIDFVLHSIAFAPRADLHGRVVDCSAEGFALAMDVSCHSFIRMARLAEPLMAHGGALLTVSFFGADRVVDNYGLMGPVKAALESTTRYLAAELGAAGIRVNALSPGPIRTRAASGIADFDALLDAAAALVPAHRLVDIADVGALAAFLASDAARHITGTVIPVDSGQQLFG